ncbi:division/cell wall cluster transcriptional repressor MraZ [Coxiella burnetii]|uniref:Transcriptional regulator MraZ n=4 Tax=Coxiella burnetii TaxID=777 RepID=MRAZ_COXBU|nr:division/cell wall cluster transcriptional repressor MraZ [Coxiella burnetii]A9KET3.1 RecName: Full=Transcriptional regulator MraZ [Coxiella burnetii Dugway 5J108-111]A9NA24.1 RecName: Full=Transcriptional regulator MraZ [Coxiella burnetii RSA 331]Q83F36.1 RecName: Full=Transcriptional regulator MraZ [Coxiella burnetii RSA 493]AIT64124.1 Protein MraZ [Coxiella burnetii str. Namibia]ATN86634.1 division/cell wall cluster transcriptional repressor MraZ [Coxiella burnetii str. Schperling]EAX33
MFRGLNPIAVDAKGRIAIPARYREPIESEADGILVVTIDTEERCLLIYTHPQWEQIEQKLENLPSYHPASRRIQRLLIGHATEVELDRSGRILIPPVLREYAGLGSMVMLVGQGKKFELWGKSQWETAREDWLAEELPKGDDLPPELRSLSL